MLLAALPALLGLWLHPRKPVLSWSQPSGTEVDLSDIAQWTEPFLWVDARSTTDYELRHIPRAISLNEDSWEKLLSDFLAAWRPGSRIVVYCDSQKCDASKEVARRLERDLNFSNVYVVKGGWTSWLAVDVGREIIEFDIGDVADTFLDSDEDGGGGCRCRLLPARHLSGELLRIRRQMSSEQ